MDIVVAAVQPVAEKEAGDGRELARVLGQHVRHLVREQVRQLIVAERIAAMKSVDTSSFRRPSRGGSSQPEQVLDLPGKSRPRRGARRPPRAEAGQNRRSRASATVVAGSSRPDRASALRRAHFLRRQRVDPTALNARSSRKIEQWLGADEGRARSSRR